MEKCNVLNKTVFKIGTIKLSGSAYKGSKCLGLEIISLAKYYNSILVVRLFNLSECLKALN